MSWLPPNEPSNEEAPCPALEQVIVTRTRDLADGFQVRRALPSARRRMVGPFIFLDQMGPHVFGAGHGLDVRPHPHIGLATVTYLFEGEILHRDSLGVVQPIRPGEVNWMTSGRGIAHSERTPPALRASGGTVFGIQLWVALPRTHEEVEPSFAHHGSAELPVLDDGGAQVRVVVGEIYGVRSPVKTFSEMFYVDAALAGGAAMPFPALHDERALYVADGSIEVSGEQFDAGRLLVFRPGDEITVRAAAGPESKGARVILIGGEPMDAARHIEWNFVSSSRERIEQAKEDWRKHRFGAVPGDAERIELPGDPPPIVSYP